MAAMELPGRHTLFVLPREAEVLFKSLRNLEGVRTLRCHELNAYAVLWADNLVFLQSALSGAEEVFGT
jgi:large subunit ribosomal protein L4